MSNLLEGRDIFSLEDGEVLPFLSDEEGNVYQVIKPNSRADPFSVLHKPGFNKERLLYYLHQAEDALAREDLTTLRDALGKVRNEALKKCE